MNIKILTVFLMACEKMLVLKSRTFLTRLWCIVELYSRYRMSSEDERVSTVEVIDIDKRTKRWVS